MDRMFLVDTPHEFTTLADGTTVSRVQIAKTGNFKDPRYGAFSITTKDFASWIKNFSEFQGADGRLGVPVDVDHSPEKGQGTEAAGWLTKLDTMGADGSTGTPNELWATVEWNTLGQELVGDRRYAYLSPSYAHNYRDERGKPHGTTLVGVGLTNRPFLTMATVSLSEGDIVSAVIPATVHLSQEASDSPAHMPSELRIKLIEKFSLAADATDEVILAAVAEAEVETPETGEAKTLEQRAQEAGMVILDAELVKTLSADAAAGREASKTLSTMRFDTEWSEAVSKGRKVPAEKEAFQKFYALDADATIDMLRNAPQIVNTEVIGSGADGGGASLAADSDGMSVDPDRQALHERALVLSAERKIDYSEAIYLAAEGV